MDKKEERKEPITIHVTEEMANWIHPQTEERKELILKRTEDLKKRLLKRIENDNRK